MLALAARRYADRSRWRPSGPDRRLHVTVELPVNGSDDTPAPALRGPSKRHEQSLLRVG